MIPSCPGLASIVPRQRRSQSEWPKAGHDHWPLPQLQSDQSSSSGPGKFCSSASSEISVTGEETTYCPLAHFPKSISRQRSLQKGKSSPALCTGFLQMGHLSLDFSATLLL